MRHHATGRHATGCRATALLLGPLLALAGTLAVPGTASAATGSALTFVDFFSAPE